MNSYDLILNKNQSLSEYSSSLNTMSSASCSSLSASSIYIVSTSKFDNNFKPKKIMLDALLAQTSLQASKQQKKQKSFSVIKSKILKSNLFKKSEKKNILISSKCNIVKTSKIEKKEDKNLVSAIYKIMDKSFGWLHKKSLKKSSKKVASLKSKKLSDEFSIPFSLDSSAYQSQLNNASSCLSLNQNYYEQQTIENETQDMSDLNEKFYFQKSSYLLSAPSMCSSFDLINPKSIEKESDEQLHSTPRSLFQQFSPIKYSNSSFELSQTSYMSESNSILSFTPSVSRRRLSFGVTSSPVSLNENIIENSNDKSNLVDLRLLEHLNVIKKNIRLDVESRNLNYNKRNLNEIENNNSNENLSLNKTKKRKLQQIFQVKLKKQLNEIKKWQVGIKNEFEFDDNNDFYLSNTNNKYQKNPRRHSTHSTKRRNIDDYEDIAKLNRANNMHENHCNCNMRISRENFYKLKAQQAHSQRQLHQFKQFQHYQQPIQCQCFNNFNILNGFHLHQDYFYNNYYNNPSHSHNFNPYNFNQQECFLSTRPHNHYQNIYFNHNQNNCCLMKNYY